MQSLRPLEQKIFNVICEFCERNNGAPPTLREIQQELGYASHTPIGYQVHNLIEKGYLVYLPSRRLRVVNALWLTPWRAHALRRAIVGSTVYVGQKRYRHILIPMDDET